MRGFNAYRIEGDVAFLALTDRNGDFTAEAIVDAVDIPALIELGRRWRVSGNGKGNLYVGTSKSLRLHRWLLGDEHECIDHINGNGLDNRRCNLRGCSHAENMANMRLSRRNTSGYKGVVRERGKWRAQIEMKTGCHRRKYSLGRFRCPIQAARAYDQKARELFGEFAHLNFPSEASPA